MNLVRHPHHLVARFFVSLSSSPPAAGRRGVGRVAPAARRDRPVAADEQHRPQALDEGGAAVRGGPTRCRPGRDRRRAAARRRQDRVRARHVRPRRRIGGRAARAHASARITTTSGSGPSWWPPAGSDPATVDLIAERGPAMATLKACDPSVSGARRRRCRSPSPSRPCWWRAVSRWDGRRGRRLGAGRGRRLHGGDAVPVVGVAAGQRPGHRRRAGPGHRAAARRRHVHASGDRARRGAAVGGGGGGGQRHRDRPDRAVVPHGVPQRCGRAPWPRT